MVGRITITGSSYYFALTTSIILAVTSLAWSLPNTSNCNFLSYSTSPTLIKVESLREAFIKFNPLSPLKVAVIPITLYLFKRRTEEISLFSLTTGASMKNKESISSTKRIVERGTMPVSKSA